MISNEVEISGYREAKREARGCTQNTTIQSSNIITLLSTIGVEVDLGFASFNCLLQRGESCFVLSNFLPGEEIIGSDIQFQFHYPFHVRIKDFKIKKKKNSKKNQKHNK